MKLKAPHDAIIIDYVHTVLLKDNVANARNFFAIYECITSCEYAFKACALL